MSLKKINKQIEALHEMKTMAFNDWSETRDKKYLLRYEQYSSELTGLFYARHAMMGNISERAYRRWN